MHAMVENGFKPSKTNPLKLRWQSEAPMQNSLIISTTDSTTTYPCSIMGHICFLTISHNLSANIILIQGDLKHSDLACKVQARPFAIRLRFEGNFWDTE